MREEVFLAKIKEIDANLEAAIRNYNINRYSIKLDKNGNPDGTIDYQELIDRLTILKQAIENEIKD